jgi:THO complex subunit 1
MPSLEMGEPAISGASAVDNLLGELLQHADTVKQTTSIEPPLSQSDFEDLPTRLAQALPSVDLPEDAEKGEHDLVKVRRWAVIETVARDRFSNLIVSGRIARDGVIDNEADHTPGDNIY